MGPMLLATANLMTGLVTRWTAFPLAKVGRPLGFSARSLSTGAGSTATWPRTSTTIAATATVAASSWVPVDGVVWEDAGQDL